MFSKEFLVAALLPLSATATFSCRNFIVPVEVTAPSFEVAFPEFTNQLESVAFLLELTSTSSSSSGSTSLFKGHPNVTSTFNISARYCSPSNLGSSNKNAKTVQVLTHGLGFDKSYWSFESMDSDYNYNKYATGAGYSTLSYDRLGTGESSFPDPYNIVQAPMELAVLTTLTEMLREGTLCKENPIPKPERVLHIGHSFGSFLTNALVAAAPTLSDGIVLTGYSTKSAGEAQWLVSTLFHQAKYDQARFSKLSSGYVTWGGTLANQYGFFYYPNFNNSVLEAAEAAKSPFTIGEMITGTLVNSSAPAFKGPVMVSTTQKD